MRCLSKHTLCRGAVLCVLLALHAGCSSQTSVQSFTPHKDMAEEALTEALTAWQNGQAEPGMIEGTDPAVQVNDSKWKSGARLKSFEITQSLPGDSPRMFAVKLTLEGAAAPEDVTYVVVGKDPLWVWTKDEYERSAGM
jgi:hypothetical protein